MTLFAARSSVAPAWRRRSRQAPSLIGQSERRMLLGVVHRAEARGASGQELPERAQRPRSAPAAGAGGARRGASSAAWTAGRRERRRDDRRLEDPLRLEQPGKRGSQRKLRAGKKRGSLARIELERRKLGFLRAPSAPSGLFPSAAPRRFRSARRKGGQARSGRRRSPLRTTGRRSCDEERRRSASITLQRTPGHALRQRGELQRDEQPKQPVRQRLAALLDELGDRRARRPAMSCRSAAVVPATGSPRAPRARPRHRRARSDRA